MMRTSYRLTPNQPRAVLAAVNGYQFVYRAPHREVRMAVIGLDLGATKLAGALFDRRRDRRASSG